MSAFGLRTPTLHQKPHDYVQQRHWFVWRKTPGGQNNIKVTGIVLMKRQFYPLKFHFNYTTTLLHIYINKHFRLGADRVGQADQSSNLANQSTLGSLRVGLKALKQHFRQRVNRVKNNVFLKH